MPALSILKINEIFWSFQGEGLRFGIPSVFIRLSGCSCGCPYCDTKNSWENGKPMKVEEITALAKSFKAKAPLSQIVITGGEPLEQDISSLINRLKEDGYFLAIETNGLHYQNIPIDWWAVSPKDVADYYITPQLVNKISEIKLVVNQNLTPAKVKKVRQQIPHVPIFLQPDGTNSHKFKDTVRLYETCQEQGIEGIRAGMQLHTIYNVR